MSLDQLDKLVHNFILEQGEAYPSCLAFLDFPKSVCLSVNDVLSHGVPNSYILKAGDYLNIDVVCFKNGSHGDTSAMVFLEDSTNKVHPLIKKLSDVTREAMFAAINECKPGVTFSRLATVITDHAENHGFHVNEEFTGHGIGPDVHMPPIV